MSLEGSRRSSRVGSDCSQPVNNGGSGQHDVLATARQPDDAPIDIKGGA
jgi:hypothetical protein